MDGEARASITTLLSRIRNGDKQAEGELYRIIEPELRKIASSYMRRERRGHILQTTALVSELFIRLSRNRRCTPKDRQHFMQVAASEIRRILVDHARNQKAKKRDREGHQLPEGVELPEAFNPHLIDIIGVDEALNLLAEKNPLAVKVIELKHFLGFTIDDITEITGLTKSQVETLYNNAKRDLRILLSFPLRSESED